VDPLNLVFMGTPDFAVPSLRALAGAGHRLLSVYCQPDRPKGRSKRPVACPVKASALELALPVHQPKRLRAKKWVSQLRELAPDLIIVVAYGQILPQTILDIPRLGCVNVHASILPRWRGASPIHHALLMGDAETGVSIMRMDAGLDSGPVYSVARTPIDDRVGRVELESRLAEMGAVLLVDTLPQLEAAKPTPQDPERVTHAPIVVKEMGYVDFQRMTASRIQRMTRAFEVWPGVSCRFRGAPLKIAAAAVSEREAGAARPGEIFAAARDGLTVACADNTALDLIELQPAGKRALPCAAFFNGYRPALGERFEPMR